MIPFWGPVHLLYDTPTRWSSDTKLGIESVPTRVQAVFDPEVCVLRSSVRINFIFPHKENILLEWVNLYLLSAPKLKRPLMI